MRKELITKGEEMYEIINSVNAHMFANKNGSINQQVLGIYVHEQGGDKVLQREGKFLICKTIEETAYEELG
jgi:hypothetical protein|tara:strand:- start:823 stop:1035 length:213 start_codon:yes stop_codon:yes gene_type:complete